MTRAVPIGEIRVSLENQLDNHSVEESVPLGWSSNKSLPSSTEEWRRQGSRSKARKSKRRCGLLRRSRASFF